MGKPSDSLEGRKKRIRDVIELREPDRVPFAPKIGNYYARGYGISMYDAMKDIRNVAPGVMGFLDDYAPDLAWAPVMYPTDPPELMGSTYLKCPGPESGLKLDASFQIHDKCYLMDDEYPEFLHDPSHFFMTKVYPRKFAGLAGLSKISFNNPVEYALYIGLASFADPEVQSALQTLMRGGEAAAKWFGGLNQIVGAIAARGFPLGAAGAQTCPFDMFGDNIRGFMNTVNDIYDNPDELLAALEYMTPLCVEGAVASAKVANLEFMFIPLHAGIDAFMSPDNYRKFYWPGLKALIMALIDIGVTPYVFCEGAYNHRLDIIADVPKGKVIYMFEDVDLAEAKRIVGQTSCICGNVPTPLLAYGSRERVIEETKKVMDIGAPGGGFIMDCSIVLDEAKKENMDAWAETTWEIGKY